MTTPDWPDPARGKKLRQLIGIARRQLGIEADAHAARVRRLTQGRATSTTDCGLGELEAILREYKALGFIPTPPPGDGARRRRATGAETAEPSSAVPTPAGAEVKRTPAPGRARSPSPPPPARWHWGRDLSQDPRVLGQAVTTPCTCSCVICRPRKHAGDTMQERRAMLDSIS